MPKLTVAKFGGTSMGSPEAMRAAARIVAKRPDVRLVVVSATSGSTNQLLAIHDARIRGESGAVEEGLRILSERHLAHADAFAQGTDRVRVDDLLEELSGIVLLAKPVEEEKLDLILSFGERLAARLFVSALREAGLDAESADARSYLRTDAHFGKAEVDLDETARLCAGLRARLADFPHIFVTEGFVGSDATGKTTTLGRGGSDYSAALFAEALGADEVQIWTDVAGILTLDPRVEPLARSIPEITFAEAAEMANFGAKVLHPATLWPANRARIPVFVGSTFAADLPGTWIRPSIGNDSPLIRAIAIRKNQTLITVSSFTMLNAHGFLAKLFEVLARHRISVDLVTTSEVSIALTLDGASLGSGGKPMRDRTDFLDELRAFADVKLEEGLSLVALIGNSLHHSPGIAATVFDAIRDFNVRLICHGASEHNLCFLVANVEAAEAARRLHRVCILRS